MDFRVRDVGGVSREGFRLHRGGEFARNLAPVVLREGLPKGVVLRKRAAAVEERRASHAAILQDHPQLLQPGEDPRGRNISGYTGRN